MCTSFEPTKAPEDGDIRLSNGTSDANGRLEILYDGQWGTVCNTGWTFAQAHVACRQLGFLGAQSHEFPDAVDAKSGDPIFLDGVICEGTEETLLNCSNAGFGSKSTTCDHSQDVAIECLKG